VVLDWDGGAVTMETPAVRDHRRSRPTMPIMPSEIGLVADTTKSMGETFDGLNCAPGAHSAGC